MFVRENIWRVWVLGYLLSLVAGCGIFLATSSLVRSLCWLVIVFYGLAVLIWGREKRCVTW